MWRLDALLRIEAPCMIIGNLSADFHESRMSTGSEIFPKLS